MKRSLPIKPMALLTLAVMVSVVLVGTLHHYTFVGGLEYDLVSGRNADGFFSQIYYIQTALSNGETQRLFQNGLLFIHLLRFMVAAPFVWIETTLGPWAPLIVMSAMMFPLTKLFPTEASNNISQALFAAARAAPFLLLLVLSGRTVLVAIGGAYLVYGVTHRTRIATLAIIVGIALVTLSSAAVMVCLLFSGAMMARGIRFERAIVLRAAVTAALLVLVIAPSFIAKLEGFSEGGTGYGTVSEYVEQKNSFNPKYSEPVVEESVGEIVGIKVKDGLPAFANRVISRSTLYTSFAYGQKLRLAVYLAMLVASLVYVAWSLYTKRGALLAVSVGVLALGLLTEGLGAWTVLWPLIWAYTGPQTPLDRFSVADR